MAQMHSIGVKFREACSGMVYRRTVYSSKQRLEEFTNLGQIINLLSNDASFIEIGLMRCQFVWITPIQVMVAAACLYFQFGYSAAIGTSVFLLVMICECQYFAFCFSFPCLLFCSMFNRVFHQSQKTSESCNWTEAPIDEWIHKWDSNPKSKCMERSFCCKDYAN